VGEHPTQGELERLLHGGLGRQEMRAVVRHLLTGCATCRAALATHSHLLFPRLPADVPVYHAAGEPCLERPAQQPRSSRPKAAQASASPAPAAQTVQKAREVRSSLQSSETPSTGEARCTQPVAATPRAMRAAKALALECLSLPRAAAAPENHQTAPTPQTAQAQQATQTTPIQKTPEAPESSEMEAAYERAIDRALASVVRYGTHASRESKRVKQVLAVLDQRGVAGFCELPAHLRGLAGYEALLERSWSLRHDDPRQMVQLCELATVVAAGLSAKRLGRERVRDLQSRAAIELANAYRVIGRPEEAQASLNEALEFFRMGTQDRLMAARLFVIQAQVSGDRRNFATALAAFDSAISVYREFGEPHQVGDTLIKKGMYCGYACRTDEALKLLTEGLALIDPSTHPELALLAIHNLANILVDCAKYREARTLLWRNQPLYQRYGGRVLRLKLRLLEGRIHAGIDEPERAERDLDEARRGFAEIGQPYMATLVLLDLAVVHIRQGRDDDARREALEAADIFLGLNIGREAAVAMMLLKSTVKFRLATTAVLLEEMAEFMRAAEHDPQLSFHNFLS
jgi:tetratricopeptide (TPR) repeat protein